MSSVAAFSEKDRALLVLLADAFASTLVSQSAEQVVEMLVSSKPSLVDDYTEIALLVQLTMIRRQCRFACSGDRAAYASLADLWEKLYAIIPDHSALALAAALRENAILDVKSEQHLSMKILRASFMLASRIQGEVLRSTQSLSRRCEDIAVNIFDLPFLAS